MIGLEWEKNHLQTGHCIFLLSFVIAHFEQHLFPCFIIFILHRKCFTISCSTAIFTFVVWLIISFSVYLQHWEHCMINLHVFPLLFPWHGSSHSRQHWSDLLEMNGLITGSERRRNTVWHGDEWNGGLGLRKSLRQIEGINDCNIARGPQWPTLFPGTMTV